MAIYVWRIVGSESYCGSLSVAYKLHMALRIVLANIITVSLSIQVVAHMLTTRSVGIWILIPFTARPRRSIATTLMYKYL